MPPALNAAQPSLLCRAMAKHRYAVVSPTAISWRAALPRCCAPGSAAVPLAAGCSRRRRRAGRRGTPLPTTAPAATSSAGLRVVFWARPMGICVHTATLPLLLGSLRCLAGAGRLLALPSGDATGMLLTAGGRTMRTLVLWRQPRVPAACLFSHTGDKTPADLGRAWTLRGAHVGSFVMLPYRLALSGVAVTFSTAQPGAWIRIFTFHLYPIQAGSRSGTVGLLVHGLSTARAPRFASNGTAGIYATRGGISRTLTPLPLLRCAPRCDRCA